MLNNFFLLNLTIGYPNIPEIILENMSAPSVFQLGSCSSAFGFSVLFCPCTSNFIITTLVVFVSISTTDIVVLVALQNVNVFLKIAQV